MQRADAQDVKIKPEWPPRKKELNFAGIAKKIKPAKNGGSMGKQGKRL
jgi:hypothetical protein